MSIIDLTSSNSKNKFKRFTYNNLYKPSPSPELEIVYSEYNSKPIPKQLKHKRKKRIILLVFDIYLPGSLESSTKTFKNKSKRYKGYSYYKFTEYHLSKHINN
jgi:hypothetical protein